MQDQAKKSWQPMQVRYVGEVSELVRHHRPGHAGGPPNGNPGRGRGLPSWSS